MKIVEAKPRSTKGRRGRALAGLARLHHECHRFREEVVCIRSFSQLQLRWPSLARLEIGNESSEEGDTIWDASEAQTSDTLPICTKAEGISEAYSGDCVELPSQELACVSGSAMDERWGGPEKDWRSPEDLETRQKSSDVLVEISQGCGDFARDTVCSKAGNDKGAMDSQGSSDHTSEFKMSDQNLEPLIAVKETSGPSHVASFMDPESGQDSPKVQILSNVLANSGARKAATAQFTANPHYSSHEPSAGRSPYNNFKCQSEELKLVGFSGSNVSDSASHKEREVRSEKLLCSSFESRICSPSELSGYATIDKRNQTSPVETVSLEDEDTGCDKSAHSLQTHHGKHLLSSLPPEALNCGSDGGHVCEEVQAKLELKGLEFSRPSSNFIGQGQNWGSQNVKGKSLTSLTTDCVDHSQWTSLIADSSGGSVEFSPSTNIQPQNWLEKQGRENHHVLLTVDSVKGQIPPASCMSGLGESSYFPTSASFQKDFHSILPTERELVGGPVKKQVSSGSGLSALSGMENFARLRVGSTRDSAMASQMTMRIKHALESLGSNRHHDYGYTKSNSEGRKIYGPYCPVNERWKDPFHASGSTTDNSVDRSDLQRLKNPGALCENSETRRLEPHFFSHRDHDEQMLGCGRTTPEARVKTFVLHPSDQAESPTPEPDLYMQHVIAALNVGHKSDVKVSSLVTPSLKTGLACYGDKEGVTDNSILDCSSPNSEEILAEKKPGGDKNSSDELNVAHCYPRQQPSMEDSSEDIPAFSIQINVPAGSFVEVEAGGQHIVSDRVEEANHQAVENPFVHSSTVYHQGRPNLQLAQGKSTLLRQRSLQTVPSTHQETPPAPGLSVSPLYPMKGSRVDKVTHDEAAHSDISNLSSPMSSQVDLAPCKSKRTVRFRTQEEFLHTFDRKIANLVRKANQLEEETVLPNTSHTMHSSRLHQRQIEVKGLASQPGFIPSKKASEAIITHRSGAYEGQQCTECIGRTRDHESEDAGLASKIKEVRQIQLPSILKSSTTIKSLDLESPDAAAGLARELSVLMKDRRPELNLECRAKNQRKVVWASPEAYELGSKPTGKPLNTQSGRQPRSPKHSQPLHSSTAHRNCARFNNAVPLAAQAVREVGKLKEQQKNLSPKQDVTPKQPQSPLRLSVRKCYKVDAAAVASPTESAKKQFSQESSHKSKQSRAVQEKGLTGAIKILDDSVGRNFNSDEFREELRELQSERKKLESLVRTLVSSNTVQREQNAREASGDEKKHPASRKTITVDPSVGVGNKRQRSAISPLIESCKKVIPSDSSRVRLPGESIIEMKSIQQKQMDAETRGMPFKRISELPQSKKRGQQVARAIIVERTLEPPDDLAKACVPSCVPSCDTMGNKAMTTGHPPIDTQTNLNIGSTLHHTKAMEELPLTAMLRGDVLNLDQQVGKDVPDYCQQYLKIPAPSSSTQLRQHVVCDQEELQDVAAHRAMASDMHGPEKVLAKPDFFKECLLEALESSTILLQDCVNQSLVKDPALLNRPESTKFITQMTETSEGEKSGAVNCSGDLLEGETSIKKPGVVMSKVPDIENKEYFSAGELHNCNFHSHVNSSQQDGRNLKNGDAVYHRNPDLNKNPPESMVPEVSLEGVKSELEMGMPPYQSHEYHFWATSSEKDTSCSGSLKSVLAAYKAAQNSAALMLSSSLEVQKLKEKTPFSSRYVNSEKIPAVEKTKPKMVRVRKNEVKFTPCELLEEELRLRRACKEHVKSKQMVQNSGLSGAKDKLQGRLRKGDLKRQELKVSHLVFPTAELGQKRREDWNDSTEILHDKGLNINAKAVAQALITKVLKDELTRKQKQQRIKKLQPLKTPKAEIRRKRKDPTHLETYASTLALMTVKDKPLLTKSTPSRKEGKRERSEKQQIEEDVTIEQSTTPLSMRGKREDFANYFHVIRNEPETENHVLDEVTLAFKKTKEHSERHTSGSGANLMNQDVRDSIEHWLDTSGGFEYLDTYDKVEENLFGRQASTSSMRRTDFSMTTEVSKTNISDETCLDRLTPPNFDLQRMEKSPQGDLAVDTSSLVERHAAQSSTGEHEEFLSSVRIFSKDTDNIGVKGHSCLEMEKVSQTDSVGVSKVAVQHVKEYSSMELGHVDSITDEVQWMYRRGVSKEDGNMYPSHKPSNGGRFSASGHVIHQKAEEFSPGKQVHADPPDLSEANKYGNVLSRDIKAKLSEDEELELALLEIVLHTILKDDLAPETTEKLTRATSPTPAEGHPDVFSGTAITLLSRPVSTGQETSKFVNGTRLHDGTSFEQGVQAVVPNLTLLDFSSEEHGSGSVISSGGDWPEYKCLAEMQSGLESSEEGKQWPEYDGVDDQEVLVDLDQGARIDEVPSEQISALPGSEQETDRKLSEGTLPSQAATGSTRPPYSANHTMRAAERQPIDFPGIASLAFGYPSPRPPPLKPACQTLADRPSVSVQTADMLVPQFPVLAPSVFVVPFYCLTDGRAILPPYSMYPAPILASEGPSQASAMPIAAPGFQFAPQYAPTPTFMFPPSHPASEGLSQISTIPVAPAALNTAAGYAPSPVENPPFAASSSPNPASEGPSQPSTSIAAATDLPPISGKASSRHLKDLSDHVLKTEMISKLPSDHRASFSSLDSGCSSPTTPSSYLSSPEHELKVASALAHSSRIVQGTVAHVFQGGSIDESEAIREEVCQSKQDQDTLVDDFGSLLLPNLMNTNLEGLPIKLLTTESFCSQSRVDTAPALLPFATCPASSGTGNKPEAGASLSVDSARNSALIGSYDGSGSSVGSVRHGRGSACERLSSQSSQKEVGQFYQMPPKSAGRLAETQTSPRSSGEILGPTGISSQRSDGFQTYLKGRFFSRTPISEGEIEPGEMQSEGECCYPYPNALGSHQGFRFVRPTNGQVDVSELGEIGEQAASQLHLPKSTQTCEGEGRSNQSLSEGELIAGTFTEPGEVKERIESTEI